MAFFRECENGWCLAVWDKNSDKIRDLGEPFETKNYLAPQWDKAGKRITFAIPAKEKDPGKPPRVQVVKSTDKRIPGDWFFVNKRKAALSVIDVSSGKEVKLLPEPFYLRSFRVSPNGRNLIYTAPSPETFGVVRGERSETFVIPLSGGTPKKVLLSKGRGGRYTWSPDGKYLLFLEKGIIKAIPPEGGKPKPFAEKVDMSVSNPVWSPDGKSFICMIPDKNITDPEIEPPQPNMNSIARPFMDLYLVSTKDGKTKNITASFEDNVSQSRWSPDGKAVFFKATNNKNYNETIYAFTLKDQKLKVLSQGEESFSLTSAAPGKLVVTIQNAKHPQDLWLFDTGTGSKKQITDLNPQLTNFRFSKPELFYYYNADGEKLGALLNKPVDYKPGQKVPVITNVYEKLTPRRHSFNARHQIFLNHGYAVLQPNVKIKVGAPGTSYVKCVVPAVNTVRAMGITNGKFAIWGGSFGGYATSFLITQTDIFACAVSRATPPELFRNWASGRDRDSYNIVRGQARIGGNPFEVQERYISQSAFFHLDKVNTPVLIMHGVEDYTILFAESEMMFYALRQLEKEATFVIYNYGDHSLSRHSRSDTLDVNHRMLEWFEKYLKK